MATGINMLGDIHGGAGEQCAELFYKISSRIDNGATFEIAIEEELREWKSVNGKIISGFGHRFHKPIDPRAPRLLELVRLAAKDDIVSGKYADIAEAIQSHLSIKKDIAMNIDGATAVIFCELGFPAPLSRGLFCLSRSVGILSHAWEQIEQGGRNKGPMPPKYLPKYISKNT
jgi:citrate synthase